MGESEKSTRSVDDFSVIRAAAAVRDPARQVEILGEHIADLPLLPAATFLKTIVGRATADLACGKDFLSLLDLSALTRAAGADRIQRLRKTFRSESQFEELDSLFERLVMIDRDHLDVVKAKVAFMIQLLFLLRDRAEEDGIPQTSYSAVRAVVDVTDSTLGRSNARQSMTVDLGHFGSAYRHILTELLKEADFRTEDNQVYELLLSEPVIRQYAAGGGLLSMDAGDGHTRMSDAVVARMGVNLVKRLSLLARTVTMYPPDHPGIEPMFESLVVSVDELMVEKDQVTISRLGTDILLEDVRIKKKIKALADFATEMEERNLNSITFRKQTGLEELRTFIFLFAQTPQQIKKRGGVKAILEKNGVSHIAVDQFKYGIIADDGAPDGAASSGGDKAVEAAVLTEVMRRMQAGEGVEDISAADLGAALKAVLDGDAETTRDVRKSLAQMLLTLDPDLMERAIFEKGIISEELSWSSARKMIDQLLEELEMPVAEMRGRAVSSLGQLADVAVQRDKETSLAVIIERLSERLWVKEKDLDVCQRIFEVLADLARHLILQGKYRKGYQIARLFQRFIDFAKNLPADRRDVFSRAMAEMAANAVTAVPEEGVITALTNELAGSDTTGQEIAGRLLQILAHDTTVEGLLLMFLDDSRSVRNRAFQTLSNLGERSLGVCCAKLRNLNDKDLFTRDVSSGMLSDHAWYIARNCVDLIAKIGGKSEVDLVRQTADDPDWRIRRESLAALVKLDAKEAIFLARLKLGDKEPDVVEAAIQALGLLQAREHADDLIELLFVERRYRPVVVAALTKIGGAKAESILLAALRFRSRTPAARVFADDFQLRQAAVRALGHVGGRQTLTECDRLLGQWRNPVTRFVRFPVRSLVKWKEFIPAVTEAESRVRYRLASASRPRAEAT